MSKKNTKLSLKKQTLRQLDSLTAEQLQAVGGGTQAVMLSVVVPPPSKTGTGGCDTSGCLNLNINLNYKGYP